jgi:micrococcal nuclease
MRWIWQARALRVIDGDTLDVELDVGFNSRRIERVRLANVNTPETKGATRAAGLDAMSFTLDWISQHRSHTDGAIKTFPAWPFTVETFKADSFGRYIATISNTAGESLNDALIAAGHAVPFMVGKGQPGA